MSDTPRTDSEAFLPHDSKYKVCDDDFARQLERELNAANDEIEEKRKDVVWLATEKAKLEERLQRLEEAGDALYEAWLGYGFTKDNHLTAWRKAKEAKP